jgi:hypothetical protein
VVVQGSATSLYTIKTADDKVGGGGASLGMLHTVVHKKYLRLQTKSRCDDDISS